MDDGGNAGSRLERSIYQPLDATKREIRILRLQRGTGDAQVEGELLITSIPQLAPIADPEWDTEDKLSRGLANVKELQLKNIRLISELIKGLENQQTALQREYDSLRAQTRPSDEESFGAQQKALASHLKQALARTEQLRRSRQELMQVVKQNDPRSKESGTNDLDASYLAKDAKKTSTAQSESLYQQAPIVEYEALSYCWNPEPACTDMIFNGVAFRAPSSATEVLSNLRFADRDHPDERAQQVAMMGEIYRSSTTTIIWLGPSYDDVETQRAFQLCSAVAQQLLQGQELSQLSDLDTVVSTCEGISIPEECSPVHLDTIYSRRWFTRLWGWQEAALSRLSVCQIGSFTITWECIMLTASWWIESADQYADLLDKRLPSDETELNMHFPSTIFMNGIKSDYGTPFRGPHLSEIVRQSRHCNATDGRDKTFGLLGLTRWSKSGRPLPAGITPNYREAKRNCIVNATRVMLDEDRNLDALSDDLLDVERGPSSEYESWPSWVPIWCETFDIPRPLWLDATYRADNTRALYISTPVQGVTSDILKLRGYSVDAIKGSILITQEHFADFENDPTTFHLLYEFTETFAAFPVEVLLLTLLADRHQREDIDEDSPIIKRCIDYLTAQCTATSYLPTKHFKHGAVHDVTKEQFQGEIDSIASDLRLTSVDRRLFVTTHGRIGIGPVTIRDGDITTVIFGGKWPFILRRQKDGYILVGHSFVRGIMKGEFVREMEAKGASVERFDIY